MLLWVRMAGWVCSVSFKVSSGPPAMSFDKGKPSAASACWSTAPAEGSASASATPMPAFSTEGLRAELEHAIGHWMANRFTDSPRFEGIPHEQLELKDKTGKTALHCAAERGDAQAVKALLEKGADVKSVDSKGMTPVSRQSSCPVRVNYPDRSVPPFPGRRLCLE